MSKAKEILNMLEGIDRFMQDILDGLDFINDPKIENLYAEKDGTITYHSKTKLNKQEMADYARDLIKALKQEGFKYKLQSSSANGYVLKES